MTNTASGLVQVIDDFESINETIVGGRADSADLHQYRFPKLRQHLAHVRDMVMMRGGIMT